MGALLNKSSAKKDTGDAQQQAAAAGPSDEPKPETAETAGVRFVFTYPEIGTCVVKVELGDKLTEFLYTNFL